MNNLRLSKDPNPPPELFGWSTVSCEKHHHFAIKNICTSVGASMMYDQALNSNYYAIHVNDPKQIEEIRGVFANIVFTADDIAGTRLTYYTKGKLVEKYIEALDDKRK